MTILIILGALAVATASAVLLFSWSFARMWCRPKRQISTQHPADFHLPSEEVAFQSRSVRLKGWFIPSATQLSNRPVVVLAHGWSHNAGYMLPLARQIYTTGASILLYDARGHGESSGGGPITMLNIAQDIIAAVNYLKSRPDVDANRIAVAGHSMGGSSTLLAASMEPSIRAAASSSAFADPARLTEATLRYFHIPRWPVFPLVRFFIERWLGGRSMGSIAPVNRIGRIVVPLLLVHGEQDRMIAPWNMEKLYQEANKRITKTLLIPGRRHMDVIRDPQYTEQITAFFRQALSVPVGGSSTMSSAAG
jgi:dipeptidyl aminopeptidase/acylaminoacyl peptidase